MPVRPLPITAVSAANGLGRTSAEILARLDADETGLAPAPPELALPFPAWLGVVPGELPELPDALAPWRTRQARLAALALEEMRDAVDRARAQWGRDRVGVVIGTTTGGIADTERVHRQTLARGAFPPGFDLETQHTVHATADVLARLADVAGPTFVQSSACSSSAKVLATARRLIALGVCDAVLVGGIDTRCAFTILGFHAMGILSDAPCLPFSAERSGINLGEAAALLLVEREGAPLAWLRGVGETSDAHHLTQPDPEGAGLEAAIRAALEQAGLPASAVDLVNAHATGTPLNDAAEALALTRALPHRPVVVGTKGHTGHTLGAAGATEAVLCVLALRHGWTPGTRTRAPLLPEGANLDIATRRRAGPFRVALSTSAAFAGHNAAVLLEAP